ncbi:DUF4321 domain-containing protein [Wukongibacter baidiensis]|uniref:DUF4321 domain-containing protein n=1 Tax=Wukongibacter baidiensis TaxID=1723361 RepID=UPI003D7F255A
MRGKNRNPWLLLLLLLVGLVIGGVIGDIFRDSIKWLGYSKSIGLEPTPLDLNVIKLTFGFTMKINLASVIGLVISIIIFNRL